MGGKIEAFIDCVSPYSLFAFKYLREQRPVLATHGVEVEFIPIFLGGVNVGSGNKPPWTLPAKAKYGEFDRRRASAYFGVKHLPAPPFFPILSLLPQRCMVYIKAHHPAAVYERAFLSVCTSLWALSPALDVSRPDTLSQVLGQTFAADEVAAILTGAGGAACKEALAASTARAVELGAFGAPFFWVRSDEKGTEEPFFGSDRFHYMFDYLGLPVQHLSIQEKPKASL